MSRREYWQVSAACAALAAATLTLAAAPAAALRPDPALVASGDVTPVASLPGWNEPLPCELYSGFVNITATAAPGVDMRMHYLFYGKEGAAPDDDDSPIIVWYNGGPGAPSSWGLFVENGPLLANEQSWTLPTANLSDGTPGLVRNPWAWTRFANVLAFDNPPPTGFSYCGPPGPGGDGAACGLWNDTRVGLVNAEAIDAVLTRHFPRLLVRRERPVFVIGESYAGVYITEAVHAIAADPRYATVGAHIAGVALGDACMGTEQICFTKDGPGAKLWFLYGHGQLPNDMWAELTATCSERELRWGGVSVACDTVVKKLFKAAGDYYLYNLYSNCPTNAFASTHKKATNDEHRRDMAAKSIANPSFVRRDGEEAVAFGEFPTNFNGYWCSGDVFSIYANETALRAALNVAADSFFFIADYARGMPYNTNLKDAFPVWHALLNNRTLGGGSSTLTREFKLWSYNGDADPSFGPAQSEPRWYSFAANHSMPKTAEWRPWIATAPNVVGGYVVEWAQRVSYVTVRGSGHMVPEYRAQAAHALMSAFVNGQPPPSL